MCYYFFFSSRRRHTRCALVTGVQTCALPILSRQSLIAAGPQPHPFDRQELPLAVLEIQVSGLEGGPFARAITSLHTLIAAGAQPRSEKRSVGKECVRTCRFRWAPYH